MKFDPNAPAFGPEAQKPEDLNEVHPEAEAVVEVPVKEEEVKTEETSEEESKVPYSRFKKYHSEAKEARAEAERLKAEIEELRKPKPVQEQSDLPDYWVELYGDTEASRKAWEVQSKAQKDFMEQARREALEAVKNEKLAEEERVQKNLEFIDSSLEALEELTGRPLTETEKESVIDIVDGYGVSFEKALEIHELKQQAAKAPKVQSRNKVASITNTKTQGTASDDQANKDFNPLDWGAAVRRVTGK